MKCLALFTLLLGASLKVAAQDVKPATPVLPAAPVTAVDTVKVVKPKPAAPSIGGKWQSVDNPAVTVTVKNGRMYRTEGGNTTDLGKIKFEKQCKNISCMKMDENKKHGCFTLSGQFDISCYQILKLTGKEFIYQGFGSEETPLSFKRVK